MNITGTDSSSRTERKKEETKQKIVSVSLKLFKKYGFLETSMEQIARAVDIAKGTLYNYFPVKEAILVEYIKMAFKEKNPERIKRLRLLPDTRTRLISVLSELSEGVKIQKEIFERFLIYRVQNVLSLHKSEGEKSGIEQLAADIILQGQAAGEIRKDLPLDALLDFFDFIFVEIAKTYYLNPENFDTVKTVEKYVDLFINGAMNK